MPVCPECASEFTYEMQDLLVCSLSAHGWSPGAGGSDGDAGYGWLDAPVVKDSVGNPLADGNIVTIFKTLKVKGNPSDIEVDGFGSMVRTSRVLKKV